MDSASIARDLDILASASGSTISAEQRAVLAPSLAVLQQEGAFERAQLWGRLSAQAGDYVIAQGLGGSQAAAFADEKPQRSKVAGADPVLAEYWDSIQAIPRKSFYLGPDGVTWVPLPDVTEDVVQANKDFEAWFASEGRAADLLTGNRGNKFEYSVVIPPEPKPEKPAPAEGEEGEEAEAEAAEEEEEAGPKIEQRTLAEEQRVAFLVSQIDSSTSVVPKGSVILDSSRRALRNAYFAGVPANDARSLSQYVHLRKPESLPNLPADERSELDSAADFLDPLSLDQPKGCWSVVKDEVTGVVAVRSLVWPGYTAYHVAGTSTYGAFYAGNGQKNVDLAFML